MTQLAYKILANNLDIETLTGAFESEAIDIQAMDFPYFQIQMLDLAEEAVEIKIQGRVNLVVGSTVIETEWNDIPESVYTLEVGDKSHAINFAGHRSEQQMRVVVTPVSGATGHLTVIYHGKSTTI